MMMRLSIGTMAALATALALYLAWFITPLGDGPDETGHYSYVHSIAEGDLLPLMEQSYMVSGLWGDDHAALQPAERRNYIVQHPPLYYWIAAAPHALADALGASTQVLYRIPRAVSAISFGALLLVMFSTLRNAGVNPARALPITAGLAFLPMLMQLSTTTTNDVFLFLLCALATRSLVRFVMQKSLPDAYLCAFWLTLAGGTKMTGWVFIAPAVAILLYELRAPIKAWLIHAVGITSVALTLPIAWMLRNWVYFDTPFYREGYAELSRPALDAQTTSFLNMVADQPVMNWLFAHFHGLFGFSGYCQTPELRHLCSGAEMTQLFGFARNAFTVAVALVVLGYVVYLLRRTWQDARQSPVIPRAALLGVPLAIGLWAGVTLLTTSFIDFSSHYEISQLLLRLDRWGGELAMLVAALLAGGWAWTRWGPRHAVPPLLGLALAVLVGIAAGWLINRMFSGQTLGDLQILIMSLLPPVGLLAGALVLLQKDGQSRLALYGPLVLLFFGSVLLYQIYQGYILAGVPRGVQGRYLYPVLPLLLVALGLALERLRVHATVCLAVLVLLGLGFADAFIERVLPFYLEVRL